MKAPALPPVAGRCTHAGAAARRERARRRAGALGRSARAPWAPALYAAALLCGSAAPAAAQPAAAAAESTNPELARSVAVTGREAFNAGDYETALALFRRAFALFPAPTVSIYEARTLEKMGLLVEALEAYQRTIAAPLERDAPPQFLEAIQAAREESDSLRARIPTLAVELRGASPHDPDLRVTLNGRLVTPADLDRPQPRNPGTYRLMGSLRGELQAIADVTLVPGQNRRVRLDLAGSGEEESAGAASHAPVSAAAADARGGRRVPTLSYVAGGVGLGGLGAGVISGLIANGKHGDAERLCEDQRCPAGSPGIASVDSFRSWRTISTVSYGVGVAGVATAVVLWLTASDDEHVESARRVEPWADANLAGVRGTF